LCKKPILEFFIKQNTTISKIIKVKENDSH
jgi:hypothetical protein